MYSDSWIDQTCKITEIQFSIIFCLCQFLIFIRLFSGFCHVGFSSDYVFRLFVCYPKMGNFFREKIQRVKKKLLLSHSRRTSSPNVTVNWCCLISEYCCNPSFLGLSDRFIHKVPTMQERLLLLTESCIGYRVSRRYFDFLNVQMQ